MRIAFSRVGRPKSARVEIAAVRRWLWSLRGPREGSVLGITIDRALLRRFWGPTLSGRYATVTVTDSAESVQFRGRGWSLAIMPYRGDVPGVPIPVFT
jgi:hypothetical protein